MLKDSQAYFGIMLCFLKLIINQFSNVQYKIHDT